MNDTVYSARGIDERIVLEWKVSVLQRPRRSVRSTKDLDKLMVAC